MRTRASIQILGFFLALWALAWAVHLTVDAGMRRIHFGLFGDFNRVADGQVNADIVVLGSSRATLHYDPAILTEATGWSAYNLGRIGARSEVYDGIFLHYLHHNKTPRLIILNADLNSLIGNKELYEPAQYTPYLADEGLYTALRSHNFFVWKMRYLPLYGYVVNDVERRRYLGLRALFGLQPTADTNQGYLPLDVEWSETRSGIDPNQKESIYTADPEGTADFLKTLIAARARDIPAIVVFSPVHHRHLARVRDLASVKNEIAQLVQGQGAEFWDYSALDPVSGSNEYFTDYFHLNRKGATAFSTVLGQRLAVWLASHAGTH